MVRVIKPQTLGILLRTQRRGNNTHYIVSALGLFDVASPEMFLAEQALWPAVMKELPEGAVFDQGLPKRKVSSSSPVTPRRRVDHPRAR